MNSYLTVNRIEFIVTCRCNSHCKHCQVEDAQRRSRPTALDRDLAAHIVRRVAEAYTPRSVMTFGGEPLLYPDVVCAIHAAAAECGIGQRQIITNGGVPRAGAASRVLARRLADSGVNDVALSVDAFHQEWIPLQVVEQNARAMLEAGIPHLRWNPCWLVAREDDNPWNRRTRDVLRALSHLGIEEDEGNVVQPDGHARQWLAEYLPGRIPCPTGACGDMPYTGPLDQVDSISIMPDGQVEVCSELSIGSAAERDIVEILQGYDPYRVPEMRALLEGGVTALAALARERGVEPDPAGYYSVCDMCLSLRRAL
jgi:hypothetical protein